MQNKIRKVIKSHIDYMVEDLVYLFELESSKFKPVASSQWAKQVCKGGCKHGKKK